jgi:hypothetical protein
MKDFLDRFNDIHQMSKLLKTTQFNNHLLIPIKVIKKLDDKKYDLLIGNKEISTTSYIYLDEGIKYWAELSSSKEGGIKLSNLKKQPNILQIDEFPIYFELDSINKILCLDNPYSYIKDITLEALENSDNKFVFSFLINMLNSIEQKVLTIPFVYNNKYNFIQLSPSKNSLKFILTTNNLGILKGIINRHNDIYSLRISTSFSNGYEYLLSEIKEYLEPYFTKVDVTLEDTLDTLFSFRNNTSFNI